MKLKSRQLHSDDFIDDPLLPLWNLTHDLIGCHQTDNLGSIGSAYLSPHSFVAIGGGDSNLATVMFIASDKVGEEFVLS